MKIAFETHCFSLFFKAALYLHIVEGSPFELVELLFLKSALSRGGAEYVGVGQAERQDFQNQILVISL